MVQHSGLVPCTGCGRPVWPEAPLCDACRAKPAVIEEKPKVAEEKPVSTKPVSTKAPGRAATGKKGK